MVSGSEKQIGIIAGAIFILGLSFWGMLYYQHITKEVGKIEYSLVDFHAENLKSKSYDTELKKSFEDNIITQQEFKKLMDIVESEKAKKIKDSLENRINNAGEK